ncbi:MAG TPA: restriction endonuclease subunit S [Rubrivivax sp.]|nr:restriction endonuclease subunit S [Rubrivivax sp.]
MGSEAMQVRDAAPGYGVETWVQDVPPGYKRTEVGVIPEDWNTAPLFSVADCLDNLRVPLNEAQRRQMQGGIPYCGANGVLDYVSDYIIDDDIILMAEDGGYFEEFASRPIAYRMLGKCWVNNHAHILKAKRGHDQGYLFFTLVHKNILPFLASGTRSKLNKGEMAKIVVPAPSSEIEQRAIAEALSDVDGLLGALEALIAKKRAIKQAAMQQLLTGKTRLPGFSGAWETKRLGEIGYFLKGSGITRDDAQSGHLACVRYGEIYTMHHDYIREFNSWISPAVAATATRLEYGDLLFAGSGETKEEIGKCVALVLDDEAYAGGDIVILRPKNVDSLFFGYALNMPDVARQKASFGQGDAVVHISGTALAQVSLLVPSIAEQTAIATVLSDMDAEIAALEARRDKTRALKQGMMQQLLTGRVRLVKPEVEPAC